MSRYIKELIAKGENTHLDFKFEISDAKKIARTFSSFANTEGGILLIGVKDNGVISGIPTDEEKYMVESAADLYCKPPVPYTIRDWTIKGKTILEVRIPESKAKPHKAPWKNDQWKAFVRYNDQNFIASSIMLDIWKTQYKKKGVLVRYKEEEKKIFHYLKNNQPSSLKQIIKACELNYYQTRKILANLVSIKLLCAEINEHGTFFSLQKE